MDSVIGIILAAGGSSRMGCPKALLPLDGAPLILHHIKQLTPVCQQIVVVLGGHVSRIEAVLPERIRQVTNPDWQRTGPAESLLIALSAPIQRAVVTPVDVPPIPASVLEMLLAVGGPAVPQWQEQDGHPVVIDSSTRDVLERGGVLRDALSRATRVAVDWPDTTLNLNTPAQWAAWKRARADRG